MTRALLLVCAWAGAAVAYPETPRPWIDLAAVAPPTPTGRPWPLDELPSVQPHLDLAMAKDACTDAARQRHAGDREVLAYLAAWCQIRAGHRDAVDQLAPLAHASRHELARAATLDIVDVLADYETARHAIDRLQRDKLATPEVLDLLAATYRALGNRDEAFVAGFEAARSDLTSPIPTTCERVLAWSSLDDHDLVLALDALGAGREPCVRRAMAMKCALVRAATTGAGYGSRLVAMRECFVELPDDPAREAKLAVMLVHATWPELDDAEAWIGLSREAETALAVRGAEALAVGALENALHDSSCGKQVVAAVAGAATRLALADFHDGAFDRRLASLKAMTPDRCAGKPAQPGSRRTSASPR